jgi:hypothetical protein
MKAKLLIIVVVGETISKEKLTSMKLKCVTRKLMQSGAPER